MRTAVIAIAKLENNYIREWTEWYKNLGFTNVILYDNNDFDGERFDEVIGDYIDSGFVLKKDCRGRSGYHQEAYQLGYNEFQDKYDWIAFFDIDEFIEIDKKYNNIDEFLGEKFFSDADIIRISWKHYDDNDILRVIDGDYSLRKRFTRPADESFRENSWTKGIVRGGLGNITVNHGVDGTHMILIPQINKAVNCRGDIVNNNTMKNGRCWENAWLCHYRFKTIEEYVNKRKRGWTVEGYDKNFTDSLFNIETFFMINKRTKEKEDLYNELISKKRIKKVLKYYWYVSPNGWNALYDIHLYNLGLYKNSFDETEFIISFDCGEIDLNEVDKTIKKLREIYPDAKFTAYQNDKEYRESKYFYYEIENKLGQFDDDTAIFFAHNKGLSTTYVTRVDCVSWINLMYYYNLRFMPLVEEALKHENVCAIGHFKMYYTHWDKCKYNWHFPGTFFWIVPSRVKKRIDEIGEGIPNWFDRYSTEGFLGTLFEYEDSACVEMKPTKGEYESIRKWLNDYATDEEKTEYTELYGSVFDNKASLDVFVFAHKPFKFERTNPCYKIVTSSGHEDITSDTAPVIRLNCLLSNIGFSEWQKIFQLFLRPQNLKDYVGLAHFHRYLQFSDDINYIPNMDDEFKKCDCVTKELSYVGNLRQQYANCHNVEDFDIVMKIIDEKFPEYSEAAKLATKNGVLIDSNIMILRKKDFILMCKFVFEVLLEYCRRVGINPSSDESFINYMKTHEEKYSKKHLPNDDEHLQQARICSFLAERLVIIYLTRKKFKLRMYKMVENKI